ncbi:enoyl-CoA hydratase/isomerase family protein [Tardiphaga sp. 367_B4_N1_1]|uniref:enoyl-CoA hydratase/isomerase family protein n=1 Tax=Tardiphaga sp. 367_B4_N1_1 TaxID=3240777 RepID=UPI003F1F70C3
MDQIEPAATEGTPTLRVEAGVAKIVLNRPSRHNCFEPHDIAVMSAQITELSGREGVRALIVSGSGETFSSGFDLVTLSGDRARTCTADFAALCDLLEDLVLPTVCAINGNIYGGATDLALACDLRIGVEGSRMMMAPARLGIQYYHSGLRRYVEQLGLSQAKRLLLTGEPIDAAAMLRIGFVHELVPARTLEARANAIAASLSHRSPRSVRGLKRSLAAIAGGTANASEIDRQFFDSLDATDAREGLRAWSEKRPPRFGDI